MDRTEPATAMPSSPGRGTARRRRHLARHVVVALAIVASAPVSASSTGMLPEQSCPPDGRIFHARFDATPVVHAEASGGHGGVDGSSLRRIQVPGIGGKDYFVHVPSRRVAGPMPVMLALHGASGSPEAAMLAAEAVRDAWSTLAERQGFAVVAPVASGASGGWLIGHDYAVFRAVIDDIATLHDVDRSRLYGWGFSAGGHVLHDLVLDVTRPGIDLHAFAGYAVSAGVMEAVACSSGGCGALLDALPRQLPLAVFVGVDDGLLPYVRSNRAGLAARGWQPLLYREFDGGHVVRGEDLDAAWRFLCRWQRLP